MNTIAHQRQRIADSIEKCDWSGCSIGNKEILKAAIAALRSSPVDIDVVADLEEVRQAVFGNVGDEPDIYSDYDRCSDLAGKMRRAIAVLSAKGGINA